VSRLIRLAFAISCFSFIACSRNGKPNTLEPRETFLIEITNRYWSTLNIYASREGSFPQSLYRGIYFNNTVLVPLPSYLRNGNITLIAKDGSTEILQCSLFIPPSPRRVIFIVINQFQSSCIAA